MFSFDRHRKSHTHTREQSAYHHAMIFPAQCESSLVNPAQGKRISMSAESCCRWSVKPGETVANCNVKTHYNNERFLKTF